MRVNGQQLQAAMRAARAVMKPSGMPGYTKGMCRLAGNGDGARVWVTDGYRVLRLAINGAGSTDAGFDEAIPRAAVRHLCATRAKEVQIERTDNDVQVRDGGEEPPATFPLETGLSEKALEDVLTAGRHDGTATEVDRREAAAALRASGAAKAEVCRMRVARDGLTFWTVNADGDGEPATAAGKAAGPERAAVTLGIRGTHLADTLRTLGAARLRIEAVEDCLPVRIRSEDGREQATLAAARVSDVRVA